MDNNTQWFDWDEVNNSLLDLVDPVELEAYQRARENVLMRSNIAEMIYSLRKAQGLSQKQLAQRAKTSQTVICALESGSRIPHLTTLRRIAEALDETCEIRLGDHSYSSQAMAS